MIEANSLTKRYGDRVAVRDVSFRCDPGTVTGFLGPNGAGKSTTLKMLCGLATPSAGDATVMGRQFTALANPGRRVGVLLDASAQHEGRRGIETLATSAQLIGVPRARADAMLELVGLDRAAGRKRVGQYSLGMRQRLGIAHALLGDPQVLILDEPANGLDPEGMRWMRGLLRDFAARGGTVLLSSHLLREVEAIADRLVVIARGEIVAEGAPGSLLSGAPQTLARTDPGDATGTDRLRMELERSGATAVEGPDHELLIDAELASVGRAALRGGVALTELRSASDAEGLEQLFFRLTEDPRSPTGGRRDVPDRQAESSKTENAVTKEAVR